VGYDPRGLSYKAFNLPSHPDHKYIWFRGGDLNPFFSPLPIFSCIRAKIPIFSCIRAKIKIPVFSYIPVQKKKERKKWIMKTVKAVN
jgi:hypothetical protein